jgi:hypothetical protein
MVLNLPAGRGQVIFALFMLVVAIPAFAYSWKEVTAARKRKGEAPPKYEKY